jgi:hypothetical protein
MTHTIVTTTASKIETTILFQMKLLLKIVQLSLTVASGTAINDLTIIKIIGITTSNKVKTTKGINNNQRLVVLTWVILSGVFLDSNFIWVLFFLITHNMNVVGASS